MYFQSRLYALCLQFSCNLRIQKQTAVLKLNCVAMNGLLMWCLEPLYGQLWLILTNTEAVQITSLDSLVLISAGFELSGLWILHIEKLLKLFMDGRQYVSMFKKFWFLLRVKFFIGVAKYRWFWLLLWSWFVQRSSTHMCLCG